MSPELAGGFFTTSATWECLMITAGSESVKKKMITYTFRLYIPFPYLLPPFFSFPLFAPWKIFFWWKRKRNTDSVAWNGPCCYWKVLIMAWNTCFSCRCLSLKALQTVKLPSVEWKTQWICSSVLPMKLEEGIEESERPVRKEEREGGDEGRRELLNVHLK